MVIKIKECAAADNAAIDQEAVLVPFSTRARLQVRPRGASKPSFTVNIRCLDDADRLPITDNGYAALGSMLAAAKTDFLMDGEGRLYTIACMPEPVLYAIRRNFRFDTRNSLA